MTGRQQNSLTLILFSPRKPRFRRRVRSSQGVAVAAHVRRRDSIFHFDEETTSSLRVARSNVFSSCYSFVLKVRFRGAKTNYYKKVRGAALVRTNYYKKFAALLWR